MAISAPTNETVSSALWNIHLCTMTADQQPYETVMRIWLQAQGHRLLARSDAPLLEKLHSAQNCDVCLILLGPTFGPCDSPLSFSHTELEVSSAIDRHPDKILIFAQHDAETTSSTEQREFVDRMRDFKQGKFQAATIATPEEFVLQVKDALAQWQPPLPRQAPFPLTVPPDAVMISSTGDPEMQVKRDIVRTLLQGQQLPVIDYLHEQSESIAPIDRIISWAQECRVLLLILGRRYGYISPVDGLGATELEFVTALRAGHPILAFIGSDVMQTMDSDQQQFVDRVCALLPDERVFFFQEASELGHEGPF